MALSAAAGGHETLNLITRPDQYGRCAIKPPVAQVMLLENTSNRRAFLLRSGNAVEQMQIESIATSKAVKLVCQRVSLWLAHPLVFTSLLRLSDRSILSL